MGDRTSVYRARFERLVARMRLEGFDSILVYGQGNKGAYSNLLYVSGYYIFDPSLECALVIRPDGDAQLLCNAAWDLERAACTSWISSRAITSFADLPSGLAHYCQSHDMASARIGVVGLERMPLEFFRGLAAGLPGVEFVSATALVASERILKSPGEVAALRVAAEITRTTIGAGLEALRQGISELQVLAACMRSMHENGGEELAFMPEVSFGKMTEVSAAPASGNKLEDGDLVLFDLGCIYQHYVGDLSRTCLYGKESRERRSILETVAKAQKTAIEAVRPGVIASEVDAIARDVVRHAGFGDFFNHGLGHGLGLDHHEPPFIEEGSQTPLRPGMVFTVEPGVYVRGVGGARIEDVVLVTEDGYEVLSQEPEEDPSSLCRA
jgi:Xaa-Pro dipeptidase